MRGKLTQLFVTVLIFTGSFRMSASDPTGRVEGRIVDPTGAVIAGADVLIHRNGRKSEDSLSKANKWIVTDVSGRFDAEVPTGIYDLCAMFDGFTPACRKVEVKSGARVTWNFAMKFDPLTKFVN